MRVARDIRRFRVFVVIALLTALPVAIAQPVGAANTDHVTNCNTSGTGSLPAVIAAAASGDTIVFNLNCPTSGPITPTSQITIAKNLTIDGTGHIVVIDGNNQTRLFSVSSTFTLALTNLTLRNGYAFQDYGGAVLNNGTLTVTGCTFTDDDADLGGGAIANTGVLTVVSSTFTHNTAIHGGGGAVYNDSNTATTITGSTFSGNPSGFGGGAIDFAGGTGTVTVTNSTFSGNSSSGPGGGGAIGVYMDGTLVMRNSTVSGNSIAMSQGGGLFTNDAGTVTVTNTIVAGNTAPTAPDVRGLFTTGGHNLIGKTDGSVGWDVSGTDRTGTVATPLDARFNPAGLASNGGPTQTVALQSTSPAIGAGDPAVCGAAPVSSVDQRGSPRPAACAIGAWEPPFITRVSPNPGGTAGGYHATLTGGGFFPGATVQFGASACTGVSVTSVTALSCVVPAGTGTVAVSATTGGGSGTKANAFTYTAVATLPHTAPMGGSPGASGTLPNSRPTGSTSGSPNPLPQPRSG